MPGLLILFLALLLLSRIVHGSSDVNFLFLVLPVVMLVHVSLSVELLFLAFFIFLRGDLLFVTRTIASYCPCSCSLFPLSDFHKFSCSAESIRSNIGFETVADQHASEVREFLTIVDIVLHFLTMI